MNEYVEINKAYREWTMLTPAETLEKSPAVNSNGVKGALWSTEEMIIESRVTVQQVADYLSEKLAVKFYWNAAISRIEHPTVYSGARIWHADEIYI